MKSDYDLWCTWCVKLNIQDWFVIKVLDLLCWRIELCAHVLHSRQQICHVFMTSMFCFFPKSCIYWKWRILSFWWGNSNKITRESRSNDKSSQSKHTWFCSLVLSKFDIPSIVWPFFTLKFVWKKAFFHIVNWGDISTCFPTFFIKHHSVATLQCDL